MVQEKIKVLIISGPTAVGKSAFGVKAAQLLNGEIISADSMQIYRGMDIGTGKITASEMHGIKHHMLDVADPDEDYSVGQYVYEAANLIKDIAIRGKLPIIVGGTGLYINSLMFGHSFSQTQRNEEIRAQLRRFVAENGNSALHQKLAEVDPVSAQKIMVNDVKRAIRAYEIYLITGKPRSEQLDENKPMYNYKMLVLTDDRETLYQRINARVDDMLNRGLIDEVRSLYRYKNCNSMQAIGYKEIIKYFDGEITVEQAIEEIKKGSRNYAKRQMTFFRGIKLEKEFLQVSDCAEYLSKMQ